ncbi:Structural maintenance of chromosomes flexible hinge domain-containing protein gmi1, partial [Thalictrum thalictroides]
GRLPFMESRQRKGDRAQVLKRCCMRVKCFIDTDAGFSPTPSKTDLAHRHPCTAALKNLGNKTLEKDMEVSVEIFRARKTLSISQLEKEYEDWVFQMHDKYDEESVCGEDDPIVVVLNPHNKKGLGISSNVVRAHKVIKRNGNTWKSGQHIKICKGAVGCHKNNLYAALEYIVLEGLEEDVCGEARLICRPLHVPVEKGCVIEIDDMNTTSLDIRGSKSFPISVIDSGKCKVMEAAELKKQLEKRDRNSPSTIDILRSKDCHQLAIEGALSFDGTVSAGSVSLEKVVAVMRPAFFDPSSSSRSLDQKSIIKADLEMSMEVTYLHEDDDPHEEHIYAERSKPSVHGGIQGLYIFSVGSRNTKHFQKSGIFRFLFTVIFEDLRCMKCEKRLIVSPDTQVNQWKHLSDKKDRTYHVRVGSCLPRVSIACLDIYGNHMPFISTPEVVVKVESTNCVIGYSRRMEDIWIESSNLDSIRPHYKANLVISSQDELYCVRIPCQVTPGVVFQVTDLCMQLEKPMLPGSVIEKLVLELKDRFGNHIEKGVEVTINVEGLGFQDQKGSMREVDDSGCIDLSGVLKVKAGYGSLVSLSLNIGEESFFKKEFQVEQRMLRIVSTVPEYCAAGSHLEDVIFEVVDSVGTVDETIHDMKFGKHTLRITSELPGIQDSLQYSFFHGRCTVPFIPLAEKEGICFIVAAHSCHPELSTNVEVHVRPSQLQKESDYNYEAIEPSQYSNREMLLLQDKAVCIVNDTQELDNDVHRAASRIEEHERKLKLLNGKKESLEQQILGLQESVEPEELNQLDYFKMVRRIEEKDNTAASVICNMLEFSLSQRQEDECMQDIIGVVALLATVSTYDLSRILAEYLREDNMLAVVCKSYATACTLEKYKEHGDIDHSDALHAVASELGKSIDGRFDVICLERIRPYAGKIEDGPQRMLALEDPLLPTGNTPPGFIGYAVNMINLNAHYITETIGGHGLRETLFYHLFGELQVYETRKDMGKAWSTIKHGAVSLDGGILRGNGVFSYGAGEPKVCFPVSVSDIQRQLSSLSASILKEITLKESELEATSGEIKKESKALYVDFLEFKQKKDRYHSFLNTKKAVVSEVCHAYSQIVKTESTELDT